MRLNAFILALCVCIHHTRAASIEVQEKKLDDLDNVDLDNVDVSNSDHENIIKDTENQLRNTDESIPVSVIQESAINENSNDYIPTDDNNVIVKRIEVDIDNPGPPQWQQHETQNPENYGDKEKAIFAVKHTIETAENVFNKGLQSISNSFKTFLSPDEDLPLIQKNIKELKNSFAYEIEKVDNSIKTYLKPDTIQSDGKAEENPNLALVNSRLKYLQQNFKIGVDTLSEGVELYSIIKEEDEAEKAIQLKADLKDTSNEPSTSSTQSPSSTPAAQPPWNQFFTNWQSAISSAFNNLTLVFSNNNANNGTQHGPAQGNNPVINFFQGIGLNGWIPGQNTQTSTETGQAASQAQSDEAVTTSAPSGPLGIFQYVQNSFQGLINPGQNNNQVEQVSQQPINNNPIQQAFQNIVTFFNPAQTTASPQPQQPTSAGTTSEKTPASDSSDIPADVVQADDSASPPVSQQAQQAQPGPVQPAPAQPAPLPGPVAAIQQLVQNNPIIKGIQDAVQRIQGTPNPNVPREEIIQDQNKDENSDPKGHYYGNRPNINAANQGDNYDGGRIEGEPEEVPSIPSVKSPDAAEQIEAEEIKTPSVSDKTE